MQFPVTIGLHRSFFLLAVKILLAILAALFCLIGPWSGLVSGGLLLALALLLYLSGYFDRLSVVALLLAADGSLSVQFGGKEKTFHPVLILQPMHVHPWLTVLRLDYEQHLLNLVLLPGHLAAGDFRRLRVWLRWRVAFIDADGDA